MTEPLNAPLQNYSELTNDQLQALLARSRRAQGRAAGNHFASLFGVLGLLFPQNRKPFGLYADA
jgi:hypothetical protein